MVNPEWLRYFVALAETRNFAAAAERLHLTPQAVSNAIAGLEQHYKLKLVERDNRVRGLTPAGEALLGEARSVLAGLERMDRAMGDWRDGTPQGPLTIAAGSLVINHVLPPVLSAMTQQFPKLRPRLHVMRGEDAERWVAAGEVDAGILAREPQHPDLTGRALFTTHYLIVGKPQPERAWHEFGYVVPRRFVASSDGDKACPSEGTIEHAWPDATKREVVAEVEDLDTAISLCEAGLGVAFLPELAVRRALQQGSLAVVAEPPATYDETFWAVWRRHVRPSPGAAALCEALTVSR